jgi:hypothetical protein
MQILPATFFPVSDNARAIAAKYPVAAARLLNTSAKFAAPGISSRAALVYRAGEVHYGADETAPRFSR